MLLLDELKNSRTFVGLSTYCLHLYSIFIVRFPAICCELVTKLFHFQKIFIIISLNGRAREKIWRERRREGRKEKRDIFSLLVHSPNGHKGQAWARMKPGTSPRSPKWVTGA